MKKHLLDNKIYGGKSSVFYDFSTFILPFFKVQVKQEQKVGRTAVLRSLQIWISIVNMNTFYLL